MALTLQDVKDYNRIDFDVDDAFIERCMQVAHAYLVHAIDDFESKLSDDVHFTHEAETCALLIASHMYQKRDGGSGDFPAFLRYLIAQLQNYEKAVPP